MPKEEDKSGMLFNWIKDRYKLRNDGELATFIKTQRSIVSEVRHGKRAVNDVMLVRICDVTKLTLKKARALIANEE